jgi:hypothetical protein
MQGTLGLDLYYIVWDSTKFNWVGCIPVKFEWDNLNSDKMLAVFVINEKTMKNINEFERKSFINSPYIKTRGQGGCAARHP